MIIPLCELIDRLTIAVLKSERLDRAFDEECSAYKDALAEWCHVGRELTMDDVRKWIEQLYRINAKIWDLEADIRRGKEGELGLEEVGRRAIEIRHLNRERVKIKNEIVQITGEGFVDKKLDHVSQEASL